MNTCSISRIEDLITSLISSSEISNQIFFIDKDVAFTYKDLHSKLEEFEDHLDLREIQPGTITAFRGSFDFLSIATLLFLLRKKTIVSLLPEATAPDTIKQPPVSHCLQFRDEVLEIEKASTHQDTPHPLVSQLLRKQESGLIFWSSGTTGQPKAVLHSFESFSRRFENKPRPVRTAAFMVFDHVGGIYNVLNCLYAKGTLVRIHDKTPTALGYLVEKERIEF
ncbi:MAG: AMP-binding protein, partial [Bdellovibrionales bacterium]|nr:AMP-binding protein [Bdellovibrionales bacterium]